MKPIYHLIICILFSTNVFAQDNAIKDSTYKVIKAQLIKLDPKFINKELINFEVFYNDSNSIMNFKGSFINDTTIKAKIKNTLFQKNSQNHKIEKNEFLNYKIIIRTFCTNHNIRHVKEVNGQNDCIWGDPELIIN
jgi:hypothetical protein